MADNQEKTEPTAAGDKDVLSESEVEVETIAVTVELVGHKFTTGLQLQPTDHVADLRQWLLSLAEYSYITCFAVELDGERVLPTAQFQSLAGFRQGCTVKIVPMTYDARQAWLHVATAQTLLLRPSLGKALPVAELLARYPAVADSHPTAAASAFKQPSIEELFVDNATTGQPTQCLKALGYSAWNPPPGGRLLQGDLGYLSATLLDGDCLQITVHVNGFFVNRSTASRFDPREHVARACHSHTLVGLLQQYSSAFKSRFATLQRTLGLNTMEERNRVTPWSAQPWCLPAIEHCADELRAEHGLLSWSEFDVINPGLMRDWNDDLQFCRDMPATTGEEVLTRQRTLHKFHSEFAEAVRVGAKAVVHGNVPAINASDTVGAQMFIWQNIFFSYALDRGDMYKNLGGDDGAHRAAGNELKGAVLYEALDTPGLYTLATAVVDYLGYRLLAQSIAPGVLRNDDQTNMIIYGITDPVRSFALDPKIDELLHKTATSLSIKPHRVRYGEGENQVERSIASSLDTKGIRGSDNRSYIMELIRTTPVDTNFLAPEPGQATLEGWTPRHNMYLQRPELVAAYFQDQLLAKVRARAAADTATTLAAKDPTVDSPSTAITINAEGEGQIDVDVVDEENEETGQLVVLQSDLEGLVANVDALNPGHPEAELADDETTVRQDEALVRDMAKYLAEGTVPRLAAQMLSQQTLFFDGVELTEQLHAKGVGARYLGMIAGSMLQQGASFSTPIVSLCVLEMLARAAKHLIRRELRATSPGGWALTVVQFLNCLLGNVTKTRGPTGSNGKRKGKNGGRANSLLSVGTASLALTTKTLWSDLASTVTQHFRFELPTSGVLAQYSIDKLALLRSICLKTGITVVARTYSLTGDETDAPFSVNDIVDMAARLKDAERPSCPDAQRYFKSGQTLYMQGKLRQAFELTEQANELFQQVYGGIHRSVGDCYRLLACILYKLGHLAVALRYQEKCTKIYEELLGVDHADTIRAYMNFGVYCGSAHYYTRGLALLQRARALCIMAVTTSSGDLSGISLQIGSLLLECQQFEAAIPYLEEALGVQAQHLAHETVILINSHRLLLRAHHGYNNFRKALDHAKKATELSARHYGEDHERTKEAQQLVVRCTTDAVAVQRMLVSLQKKQPQAFAAPAVVSKESITNNHAEGKKKKDNKNPVRSNATTAPATAPQ